MTRKVNWVLDADIRDFYGSISHEWLVKFVEHRIADKRVVRLIQKWLNAGVLEDGQVTYDDMGARRSKRIAAALQRIPALRRTTCGFNNGGRSMRTVK